MLPKREAVEKEFLLGVQRLKKSHGGLRTLTTGKHMPPEVIIWKQYFWKEEDKKERRGNFRNYLWSKKWANGIFGVFEKEKQQIRGYI